jgi:hypothetical protein
VSIRSIESDADGYQRIRKVVESYRKSSESFEVIQS